MIRQLQDELREYDQLESGESILPYVERLDQIASFIAKIRIANYERFKKLNWRDVLG